MFIHGCFHNKSHKSGIVWKFEVCVFCFGKLHIIGQTQGTMVGGGL